MIGRGHKHDFVLFINLIKEPVSTDTISPGRRIPIFKPFDIGTKMGFVSKAGIDMFLKFFLDPG
jgi:hypothetical protein